MCVPPNAMFIASSGNVHFYYHHLSLTMAACVVLCGLAGSCDPTGASFTR